MRGERAQQLELDVRQRDPTPDLRDQTVPHVNGGLGGGGSSRHGWSASWLWWSSKERVYSGHKVAVQMAERIAILEAVLKNRTA